MEDDELKMMKHSRMRVSKIGKWMSVFSYFAVLGLAFIAIGGLGLLYISEHLDPSTPHYYDNVLCVAGICMILFAAAIIPMIVFIRCAVHAAKVVRQCDEIPPLLDFLLQNRRLWKYATAVIIVLTIVAIVAIVLAAIFFVPTFQIL